MSFKLFFNVLGIVVIVVLTLVLIYGNLACFLFYNEPSLLMEVFPCLIFQAASHLCTVDD
jgi:hypothetical protein